MPLIQIVSSAEPPAHDARARLLTTLSHLLAARFRKPERWVMTSLLPRAEMTFAGTTEPACYIEVKNIGTMSADDARHVSADVTRVLTEAFGVREDRIYIEFTDATGYLWGHAGDTLA
jgi:phenylpyruvate tautomerase PptA (4-oxalocrotonate tautomerase family)